MWSSLPLRALITCSKWIDREPDQMRSIKNKPMDDFASGYFPNPR